MPVDTHDAEPDCRHGAAEERAEDESQRDHAVTYPLWAYTAPDTVPTAIQRVRPE